MKHLPLNEIIFEGQLSKDTFHTSRRGVEKGLYVTVQLGSNSIRAESLQRTLSLGEHHAGYSASPAPVYCLLWPDRSLGPISESSRWAHIPCRCHCSHVSKGSETREWHTVPAGLARRGPLRHLLPARCSWCQRAQTQQSSSST